MAAISIVGVSNLTGNAADGLFIDDGPSLYQRARYRISSFRHGATSLLSTAITQSRDYKENSKVPRIAPGAGLPISRICAKPSIGWHVFCSLFIATGNFALTDPGNTMITKHSRQQAEAAPLQSHVH
jgi:hypothetical protein